MKFFLLVGKGIGSKQSHLSEEEINAIFGLIVNS